VVVAALSLIGSGSSLTSTCGAADLPPLRSERTPLFSADVAMSLDPQGRQTFTVSVSVAYSELQWIKVPSGYAGGAEITVVFEQRKNKRQIGDVWERRLVAARFESTNSGALSLVEKRSFDVPPGRYELRVLVRDLNSSETSSAHEDYEVPDYSRVQVGFAELELGMEDGSGAFTALPTRRFGLNVRRLTARATLFDRRPGSWPRTYPFRYRVVDDLGTELFSGRRDVALGRSAEPVLVRPDSSDLFVGSYVFEIELAEGRSRWRVERSFEVEESGPPRGRDFERILEPLAYIADVQEVERLRALPVEKQAVGWDEFWRRRDPTPETARNETMLEFLRRVRYAERHFQSFGPGWRSDMGRIYIKFGAPDQVESRPATSHTPLLEIWTYNRPRRQFVFADHDGFGRFVLASPSLE